jgi:hypothetical protein
MSGNRLSNLDRLYHVPVFALRGLLEDRVPDRKFGNLRQAELIVEADKIPAITEADVEDLYENYRYGRRLSFYLYVLPEGLPELDIKEFQASLDELAVLDRSDLSEEVTADEDYEAETSPNQVIVLDEEKLGGLREIRFRYYVVRRFLNADEQPDQVLQTRYGFLWLDVDEGYLTILSRDERVNRLLARALTKCLQAIPVLVRLPKELVDEHFSIEKVKRVSHYDPASGVRQSISGHGLWQKFEQEILARERLYVRPSSLYDEEVTKGVTNGLGITGSKGKVYLTKTLPTSLVRAWGQQRLPILVRDVKDLRTERPDAFSRSIEAINRMRLSQSGKAAIITIVEGLLKADREDLTTVDLYQPAPALYHALKGKYFEPYLRAFCGKCGETAELCPHCESPSLKVNEQQVTCDNCGAAISDDENVALRCMNGHVTSVLLAEGMNLAPNHALQQRMERIFAEVGQSWSEQSDYFYIEGSTLYRLRKDKVDRDQLPSVIQNFTNNFWGPVTGPVHTGSGDIIIGNDQSEE